MDPGGIDEYIRNNRTKYTDAAIRATLLEAGHEPAAIDEAFQRQGMAAHDPNATRPPVKGMSALLAFAWLLFVLGGIIGLAGVGLAASFGTVGSLPVYLIAYIGIGLGLVLLLRWAERNIGIHGAWAVVLGIVLIPIFGGLMFGTCAAAFAIARG